MPVLASTSASIFFMSGWSWPAARRSLKSPRHRSMLARRLGKTGLLPCLLPAITWAGGGIDLTGQEGDHQIATGAVRGVRRNDQRGAAFDVRHDGERKGHQNDFPTATGGHRRRPRHYPIPKKRTPKVSSGPEFHPKHLRAQTAGWYLALHGCGQGNEQEQE